MSLEKKDLKNKFLSNIMGRKKIEINSNTTLNKVKVTLYNMIRASKKIDGRSFQKYINQVAAIKNKEENRQKLMHLYDTIVAIDKGEGKATFKKVKEFKEQKIAAIKAIQKAVRTRVIKPYWLIDILLYRLATKDDDGTAAKRVVRYGLTFIQYNSAFQLSVKAAQQFPKDLLDKFIYRDKMLDMYKKGVAILKTNEKFVEADYLDSYLAAFHILGATPTDKDIFIEYKPLEQKLQDTQKISMYHKYIDTRLNLECETFDEAIKNNIYIEKECCINTLYDYYGDGLLNPNKKQKSYLITREMILETVGKTEDNIKDGIKLPELKLFFEKYKIQFRVINEFGKIIYRYDPEVRNHNHHAMYCMVKGNHIYTLNCNIKSLEQNQDYDPQMVVKASSECMTYEDSEPIQCRMISHVNDILKLMRELSDDKETINLIHQNDDLVAVFYELQNAGYFPTVYYECGRITKLICKFNKITCIIKTQQLITCAIDGMVCVSNENVYNNMEVANVNFKKKLFRKEFKSYLTELDTMSLNEYRTVANIGMLKQHIALERKSEIYSSILLYKSYITKTNKLINTPISEAEQYEYNKMYQRFYGDDYEPKRLTRNIKELQQSVKHYDNKIHELESELAMSSCDTLVEIDVSKAYTSAFKQITEVPVFNEFDNFRIYRNEDLLDYNLYIIKSDKLDLFCNKQYNLCYGKFLKSLSNYQIIGFKRPSFIKKVDYKTISDELWDTEISSIPAEDTHIKKLIGNVNYGLLEKGQNNRIQSFVYETIDEAKTYQAQYGGTINIIRKYREELQYEHNDLDYRLDDVECGNTKHIQEGKEYFVLNVKDTAVLKDGFRYIKELLLQEFHYKLNNDYNILTNNGVDVFQ